MLYDFSGRQSIAAGELECKDEENHPDWGHPHALHHLLLLLLLRSHQVVHVEAM